MTKPAPVPIDDVVLARLRTVAPASPLHLALVEVVRRQFKLAKVHIELIGSDQ